MRGGRPAAHVDLVRGLHSTEVVHIVPNRLMAAKWKAKVRGGRKTDSAKIFSRDPVIRVSLSTWKSEYDGTNEDVRGDRPESRLPRMESGPVKSRNRVAAWS